MLKRNPLKALTPGIHLILGDSAAGVFRAAFRVQDRLLVEQDVLSCGPTPRCEDLEKWSKQRHEYWANLVPGLLDEHAPSPIALLKHVSRLRDAERIFIWAATGVSEQLFIAFVFHLIRLTAVDPARVSLVRFDTLPNRRARVIGMGELDPDQMGNSPEPLAASSDDARGYLAAWDALTAPDPVSMERFSETNPLANEWLKQAMRLMLRRFPDKHTGLPHWDFKLLESVRRNGPRAPRIIGYTMAENWNDGDLVGDWYLFGRLLRMGDEGLPKPLLSLSGDLHDMRSTTAVLTPFGESVLDGREASYPTNPIEEWAAGTRLSSRDNLIWLRDGEQLVRQ